MTTNETSPTMELAETYDIGGRILRVYAIGGRYFGRISEAAIFGPYESEPAVVRAADACLVGVR